MSKKKIWIMNHYATNSYFNKGGRHYWFAENLIKSGYQPTIFCANVRHTNNQVINVNDNKYSTDILNDIPYVFVKTADYRGNGFQRVKNMGSFYLNLFPVAKEYARLHGKPDVIIASSVHPLTMVAGIKIAKKLNIPCICEIRDLWPEAIFMYGTVKENGIIGRILTKGEHWIYKKANALVFTKEGDTDYIKEKKWDTEHGGDIDLKKAYYINNGLSIEDFEKSIREKKLEDADLNSNKFNVVYAGAIRPVNNVGIILDAASLLKNEKDIQFLIYGDGNERELLEKRVAEEGLHNVKMKGFVNKQFIPYILSKSSVNILNYSQINKHAVIGHDVTVGDYSVISPNVTIGGNVNIGLGCYIGSGAIIRNGINIGDNSIIGMGAVVLKDVETNSVMVGNPARFIRENTDKKVFK